MGCLARGTVRNDMSAPEYPLERTKVSRAKNATKTLDDCLVTAVPVERSRGRATMSMIALPAQRKVKA